MSLLVILLPVRPRDGSDAPADGRYHHVMSADGVLVGSAGWTEARLLPRADSVIAVLAAQDVAWHALTLPKAPAARLQLALAGVLEEHLLEEPEQVHLALAPGARAGEATWVGATHRAWLASQLTALQTAGVVVDRVVPALAPGASVQGHFSQALDGLGGSGDELWLSWADPSGAMCLRCSGDLARALLPGWQAQSPRWSATPAAAGAAERWLGSAVAVQSDGEQALAAARSAWNLRQFDLALDARGLRALRAAARQLTGPAWRPARWGLAALLVVQVLGLNLWAWQQQRALEARRTAMTDLLRASHPQVRAVLDAPLQMQRETDALRTAAGRASADDFEPLLGQVAGAWPDGRGPADQLRFEPARLSVGTNGWSVEQVAQLRGRLEQSGASVTSQDNQLTLSRAARRATP